MADRRPWYAEGLRFTCTQCGNCCTGPPGVVGFSAEEAHRIAERLGIAVEAFYRRFARRVDGRWSLVERLSQEGSQTREAATGQEALERFEEGVDLVLGNGEKELLVQRIADHVVMLDKGKVILDGDLDRLAASDDPRVRQFRTGELEGPAFGTTTPQDYLKDLLL
ncbi:MAG: hypothetical protein IH804_04005 [Planctomycetes bacterium]|nr:hypothetical protein [Planctomycetota bacterium]